MGLGKPFKTTEGHGAYCPGPGGYSQGLSLGCQFPEYLGSLVPSGDLDAGRRSADLVLGAQGVPNQPSLTALA